MVEFTQRGTTMTSQVYCETLKKLRRAIQNKSRGLLTYGVVLLHDNARQHIAVCTPALLEHFNWELFDYPPYSPDIAPSDYNLFTYTKKRFGTRRFNNNNELMEGVKTWLTSQTADFFDTGIQRLIPRYKCFNSSGDHVEKQLKYVRIFCI
jgi:transposase